MSIIEKMKKALAEEAPRSAWDKGVKIYAAELIADLNENINGGYFAAEDVAAPLLLKRQLLNGAQDWAQYSWGG